MSPAPRASAANGPLPGARADERLMGLALAQAARGPRGANPLVGAVLADRRGAVLAAGHHRGACTVHAEPDALAAAGRAGIDPRGATLCVTLEPCDHTGRTGPCTEAILAAGVSRVVIGAPDATGDGAGGAARLRAAGLEVRTGVLAERAGELNHRWSRARAEDRPFVTAKTAATADGFVAAAEGGSRWITGPEARAHAHRLRARVDAVLVGTGTALADDPRLTARDETGAPLPRQPLRAVMGRRTLPEAAALNRDGGSLHLDTRDPVQALRCLRERGVEHVLLEGGPSLLTAFLAAGLVDELWWYRAPLLLGEGTPAIGALGVRGLGEARPWRTDRTGPGLPDGAGGVEILGADVLTRYEPLPRPAP